MSLTPDETLFLHFYGIINGMYVAAFLYIVLFGISYYLKPNQRHIGITFLISAIGYGCLGLYNLFFQQTHMAITTTIITNPVFVLAKYAAPIAMAVMTYIFIRLTVLTSYRAYRLLNKHTLLIYSLYAIDVACFCALFFIHDTQLASFVIITCFIPHVMAAVYYAYNTLKPFTFFLSVCFLIGVIFISWLAWLIYQGQMHLPTSLFFGFHALFGLALLVFSFFTIRYGYDEAKRFFDIKELDSKQLINSIYQAIRENEFYLVYQPKVDVHTQEVRGLEALIRWNHPTLGNIPPDKFIPLAEKTQLINHICRWTIDTAVKQARIHLDKGINLPIAINFSARNVSPRIVKFLAKTLENYYVPANNIMVEITESVFIDMTEDEVEALEMLYNINVPLSLDDYGTGFSSLSYINKLSLSELKIDGGFIKTIDTNTDNLVIVNSTLQMSKGLNLKVVAEGVENDHVQHILADLGCDMVQGYGVARPMTATDLQIWLTDNRSEANQTPATETQSVKHSHTPGLST